MQASQPETSAKIQPGSESTQEGSTSSKATLIGGLIAGIGASTCCLGPFLLISLGVSGSWIGTLSAMELYRPYLMAIALIFIALAFRKLYLVPQSCDIDSPCASPDYLKKQRIFFWMASLFILAIIAFPYYGPYLLD